MPDNVVPFKFSTEKELKVDAEEMVDPALTYICLECGSTSFKLWCEGEVWCAECNQIIKNVRTYNPDEEA